MDMLYLRNGCTNLLNLRKVNACWLKHARESSQVCEVNHDNVATNLIIFKSPAAIGSLLSVASHSRLTNAEGNVDRNAWHARS